MILNKLYLTQFRSYEKREFEFTPKLNFIVGRNGSGKTNALEAVCVLSSVKSFRGVNDRKLIRNSASFYHLKGEVNDGGSEKTFEAAVSEHTETKKTLQKRFKIDGTIVESFHDYYGKLLTVSIVPTDLYLVNGVPEQKRRYIDATLSKVESEYLKKLYDYKRILSNRNSLLKDAKLKKRSTLSGISAWNRMLAEHGELLSKKRRRFIDRVNSLLTEYNRSISGDSAELEVRYLSNIDGLSADDIEKKLESELERDLRFGNTYSGIHRDSYSVYLDGFSAESYASQGQIRTASLAIKLCERDIVEESSKKKCIILVDDIFSELDKKRKNNLIRLIRMDNQVLFTIVDTELIDRDYLEESTIYTLE